jgi:hypothetical protein
VPSFHPVRVLQSAELALPSTAPHTEKFECVEEAVARSPYARFAPADAGGGSTVTGTW